MLHVAPCLGDDTACDQFRGLREIPLKSFRHHPIAAIQRQPLAHVDDSLGTVAAQAQGFQNFTHKGAVFGNDPPFQPMDDALAILTNTPSTGTEAWP